MGTGIDLFLYWENGIWIAGTGIWALGMGMGNEVLIKNGNGIEVIFHWASIPKVVGSIPTVAGHIFKLARCVCNSE